MNPTIFIEDNQVKEEVFYQGLEIEKVLHTGINEVIIVVLTCGRRLMVIHGLYLNKKEPPISDSIPKTHNRKTVKSKYK